MEKYLEQVKKPTENYYNECFSYAKVFIVGKSEFTSEDLIESYLKQTNKHPKEMRVFGAVIKELKQMGKIILVRYDKYKKKSGHGKPCAVWKTI